MSGSQCARQYIENLMVAAAPERREEIERLWSDYDPIVDVRNNARQITLRASGERIVLDAKTLNVFWLIGFSGWRAIECYTPMVMGSAASGQTLEELAQLDEELPEVERAYKERRATALALIEADDPSQVQWPPDLPQPSIENPVMPDEQFRAAFDLTCLATAFAFFHEFRHVMLDQDGNRPSDLREEELACDIWAREFMTANVAAYADANEHEYSKVLQKRSMGFALAALILHEITPVWDHGGNNAYFSIATRLESILDGTPLPESDHFWVFVASILVGVFRQKHLSLELPAMDAQSLARCLISRL